MKDQFVPCEQAVELKELGFNEPCFATYDEQFNLELQDFVQDYDTFPSHIIAAPLYQQAFRWFRTKHNLSGFALPFSQGEFDYRIYSTQEGEHLWGSPEYPTTEEAELACLKKLIELVKNK